MLLETHIPTNIKVPIRLQDYGVTIFNSIRSKSALKKHLKKELILVNGKIATTATLIKNEDKIELLSPPEHSVRKTLNLQLEVVFEDEFLAIINKPPGILVSGNKFKTIDNALIQNLTPSNQEDAVRPRPVHRLDYPTTGLLLIGKTSASILALNKLFENREISKTYYAVTIHELRTSGSIHTPIDGKTASTHFELEASIKSPRFGYLNLVKLHPKTGRKHQLRNHLSSIGNPILGDVDYGIKDLILKGKGLYLHAFSLAFYHPFTKKHLLIEKEYPKKFAKLFPKKH